MSDSTPHNKHTPLVAQALVTAVERGDAQAVEALLSSGAFADARTSGGETALMRAAAKGFDDVARVLLDAGADPRARRPDGFTPLLLAAFFGREEAVRLLLERGADPSARTDLGTTARSWAEARGFDSVAALLKKAEAAPAAAVTRKQEPAAEPFVVRRAEFEEKAVEPSERREAVAVPFESLGAARRGRESKRFFLSWQASVGTALLLTAFGIAAFAVWRTSKSARRPAQNPAPAQTPLQQAVLPEATPALVPTPSPTPDMGLTNMGPQGPLIIIPGTPTGQPVLVSPAAPAGASDVPLVISESGGADEGAANRRRTDSTPPRTADPAATPGNRPAEERRGAPSERGAQPTNPETQPRPSGPPSSTSATPAPTPTPERRKVIPWPPQ